MPRGEVLLVVPQYVIESFQNVVVVVAAAAAAVVVVDL
jgi:hypothetical protein